MDFGGKKTERVLMRVTEDMAREVKALAELECRSIQDQFRMLLMVGLQQTKANGIDVRMRPPMSTRTFASRQPASTDTFAEEEAKEFSSTPVKPGQLLLPGTAGPIPAKKRRIA